jgi:hypothetical protein
MAERRLYAFDPASNWPALAPFNGNVNPRKSGQLRHTHFRGAASLL